MQERLINIGFPIKENILLSIKGTKDDFIDDLKYLSGLYFYRKRKLSLGKAAELAGCNKIEFIERMQRDKEYIFDYNEEELSEIFEDAEKKIEIVSNTTPIIKASALSGVYGLHAGKAVRETGNLI